MSVHTIQFDVSELMAHIPQDEQIATVSWLGWGDEGKWKVAAALDGWFDIVAAANGGGNAGHNVIVGEGTDNEKKLHFHELPGAAISGVPTYISWGRVVNISKLHEEIRTLQTETTQKVNIVMSAGAQVIIPSLQQKLDADIEWLLSQGGGSVWTTKKGIWPAYALKAFRLWINIWQLLYDQDVIRKKMSALSEIFSSIDTDIVMSEFALAKTELETLIASWVVTIDETNTFIPESISQGWKKVVVECSQSAMLSLSWNAYPNCTSSECSFNGVAVHLGIEGPWYKIGVIKSVPSKVGNGCFPTKFDDNGVDTTFINQYRELAWEYGATTGRKRDVGFLDAVQLKHVFKTGNRPDMLWVNMVDLLSFLHTHGVQNKIAIGYNVRHKVTKKESVLTDTVPPDYFEIIGVEYRNLPDVTEAKDYPRYVEVLRKELWFTWPIVIGVWPGSWDNILFS
jgi:adenylosuccinate synthase